MILPLLASLFISSDLSDDTLGNGIYRVNEYPKASVQQIVFKNDAICTLESVSWLQAHGYKDNYYALGMNETIETAKRRKLSMACGHICAFAKDVLSSVGYKARLVSMLTRECPNGYDDGHVILEVYIDKRWIAVDMTTRCLFQYDSKLLNAADLIKVDWDVVELIRFSQAPILHYGTLISNGYDYTIICEINFLNDSQLRSWYKRMFQSIIYH